MQVVAPKRIALAEANKKLDNANKKLTSIRTKVKDLNDRVAALEADLMKVGMLVANFDCKRNSHPDCNLWRVQLSIYARVYFHRQPRTRT